MSKRGKANSTIDSLQGRRQRKCVSSRQSSGVNNLGRKSASKRKKQPADEKTLSNYLKNEMKKIYGEDWPLD